MNAPELGVGTRLRSVRITTPSLRKESPTSLMLRGDVKSENSKLTFSAATRLRMSMSMIAASVMGIDRGN